MEKAIAISAQTCRSGDVWAGESSRLRRERATESSVASSYLLFSAVALPFFRSGFLLRPRRSAASW
jgi:hypothetical protein